MFLVKDTREERREYIKRFLTEGEATIAVLLAAANFEWTLRRAIISLGKSSNKDVRACLERCSGLRKYSKLWKQEVAIYHGEELDAIIQNWPDLTTKYKLRHALIHGAAGSCGVTFAEPHVEVFLSAADFVDKYCCKKGVNLYKKLGTKKVAQ